MSKIKSKNVKEKINKLAFVYDTKARNSVPELLMVDKTELAPQSSLKLLFIRFIRNKLAVAGTIMLAFILFFAIFGPLIWTNYWQLSDNKNSNISSDHWFGTDNYGRDIFARVWYGLRFSVQLALIATLIDLFVGATLGIWMGYSKKADNVIMFIIKIITNIPSIIILIMLVIIFKPSLWIIVFSLTVTGWTGMAIQLRAQVLRLRESDWVVASHVLGTPKWKIIKSFFVVILPIIITQLVFTIPGVILAEASLGFIGLSIPNIPTIGNLIADSQSVFTIHPFQLYIPAFVLVSIIISIQLIGNGVQEILKASR